MNRKQKEIFEYLKHILLNKEAMPTVAELGQHFGMSQQAMSKNLRVLEREGLIVREKGKHRCIRLAQKAPEARKIPLMGTIAAGNPLEPVEDPHYIEVPASQVPNGEVYALRVQGESMIEDGILDDDVVFIKNNPWLLMGKRWWRL